MKLNLDTIPANVTVTLTTSEYEDYYVVATIKTLKEINPDKIRDELVSAGVSTYTKNAYREKKLRSVKDSVLLDFLVHSGYCQVIPTYELHLNDYDYVSLETTMVKSDET